MAARRGCEIHTQILVDTRSRHESYAPTKLWMAKAVEEAEEVVERIASKWPHAPPNLAAVFVVVLTALNHQIGFGGAPRQTEIGATNCRTPMLDDDDDYHIICASVSSQSQGWTDLVVQ
ncbi:hypothetical protein ACLKA7_015924 [Drosophila subpalustris]